MARKPAKPAAPSRDRVLRVDLNVRVKGGPFVFLSGIDGVYFRNREYQVVPYTGSPDVAAKVAAMRALERGKVFDFVADAVVAKGFGEIVDA